MLEARDRVGGRVWSRRLDNGAVVEMGAEFILPGNTAGPRAGAAARAGPLGQGHALRAARAARRHGVTESELERGRGRGRARARRRRRRSMTARALPRAARRRRRARARRCSPGRRSRAQQRRHGGRARPRRIAHVDDDPAPSIASGNQSLPLALAEGLGRAPERAGASGSPGAATGRRASTGRARGRRLRGGGARDVLDRDRASSRRCPPQLADALAGVALRRGGQAVRAAARARRRRAR